MDIHAGKFLNSFTATMVLLTLHSRSSTSSYTNSTKKSTTSAPSIANVSVSQRNYSSNATETAPAVTETAPISSINESDTTVTNYNVDHGNQTTVSTTATTSTATGATPTPDWMIATVVSFIGLGLSFSVGVIVYVCCRTGEDCCLCCCCKYYFDCSDCRRGCRKGCRKRYLKCFSADYCEICSSRHCSCQNLPLFHLAPLLHGSVEAIHSICVHLPKGQSLSLSVKGTDKVRVIKTKVTELVNVPFFYVNVYHGSTPGESDSLEDDRTFEDYGIYLGADQEFSITYVAHGVFVQFADGRLEELFGDPLLSVGDFLDGLDFKIQELRRDILQIEAHWEGRATLQELTESDTKKPLYRLRKVKMSVSFEVVLRIIGHNTLISVRVFPTDTVDTLAINFPRSVIFIFEGIELVRDKTMEEYGLHEGAVVTVDWSVTVLVTFGEKSCSYILRSSYSVGQLKELLAVDTGLHRFEQHLGFYGTVLSDEKMLSEYLTPETEDKMSITLTCQPWKVLVLLPSGTLKDYKISPNTKVAFLKSQIEEHENIPVARQILQIDQNDLADDGLLCESMIPSNSILYLKEQIALKYSSNWTPVSARWKPCFEELLQVSDGNLKEVNNVCFSTKVDRFKIGFGNKTEVFLGIRHDGREVAVKRFPRSMSQNFKNEKSVLTTLDSPNIIRYLDIAMDDEFLYLILELGEFTLNEFISTDEYKQNQTNISRDLVGQILESLRTLHTGHNVIHMDIKPHNVLLDVSNRAKLSDFGISVVLPDNQSTFYTTAKGTYHWVAKEILDSATGKVKYKKNADIQVAGMLVYYTLTGGIHPFMPNGEADVFLCNKNVQDGKHDLSALDDIVGRHLVDWMLQPDPELRPTIEEALAHPFFWNVDMRYRFLGVLGDEKEVKESWKRQPHSVTLTLDGLTVSVFNTVPHWKDLLDQAVYDEVSKPVRNGYRSTICGLLRFIRNVDVHLKDQPPAIQATVGNPMTYFTAKLPFDELFLRVYKTVRDTRSSADDWTVRGSLKEFFPA